MKCVIFGRLKYVIFGRLNCVIFGRLQCIIFERLKCTFFGGLKCIIFGRLNFILKTILKAILLLLFSYYYSINSIPYGERSSTTPLRSFVRIFFFCKSYNLDFFLKMYFYALRRFLANFQGYIASSGQTLFQTAWKSAKKGQEKPTFVKKWVRQKRTSQVASFFLLLLFCSNVSYYIGLKPWKVSS